MEDVNSGVKGWGQGAAGCRCNDGVRPNGRVRVDCSQALHPPPAHPVLRVHMVGSSVNLPDMSANLAAKVAGAWAQRVID